MKKGINFSYKLYAARESASWPVGGLNQGFVNVANSVSFSPPCPAYSYPAWALDTYQQRIAPVLGTLLTTDVIQRNWIKSCGPGDSAVTSFRFFPGSLYLLWIEALAETPSEMHVRIAATIECLHNASLHHDDALDRNGSRRSNATIYGMQGPSASILAGDGLIGIALRLVGTTCDLQEPGILTQLGEAWHRMTLGQSMDEAATWEGIATERYENHWQAMTRAKLAFGNLPAPLAALSVGHHELVDRLWKLHEDFSIASQIMNDIGDLEGWAGFHVVGHCIRKTGQEASQKPTIATIWRDALEISEQDITSFLYQKAHSEIRLLVSSALRQLDMLPIQSAAVGVLRDFFTRPLTELERIIHSSQLC